MSRQKVEGRQKAEGRRQLSRRIWRALPLAFCLLPCIALVAGARAQSTAPMPPDPAREKRLEWFREAKYGMFIHWGLYAVPAGEWKGKRCLGLGEWLMNRCQVPVTEYEQLAKQFNPVKFNPDE